MRYAAFLFLALAVFAAGCGPYRTEGDARTTEAQRTANVSAGRLSAFSLCDDVGVPGTALATPTAFFPVETQTPEAQATSGLGSDIQAPSSTPTLAAASTHAQDEPPNGSPTPCADVIVTATIDNTLTPTPRARVTAISTATPTLPLTPFDVETATGTPTPAEVLDIAATQTYRAGPQPFAYLSIGDGLQWGCCGALGSSSASLFRDYLEARIGRPVIWQSPGSGYDTTQTFINGRDGFAGQIDGSLELMAYFRREGVPLAAITMSIGGNNLVDIGLACTAPPCIPEFVAGLDVLRADLHVIYSRITAAKDARTPLFVLLYYDAKACENNPNSGPSVDAWNAVIAEVATQYGAFLIDGRSLFEGHCDWIDANGLDANAAGHSAIAGAYARAYEGLPSEFLLP